MGTILEAELPYLDQRMIQLLTVGGTTHRLTPARIAANNAKRAKDRPMCPNCGADEARQRGGHRNGHGYWKCSACEHGWKTVAKEAS